MATYSPNVSESGPAPLNNDADVLNLRPLLDVLLRWWREIFLLTAIAAAIGGGIVLYSRTQTPPTYQASAQVAIARIVTNVNLDDNFRTSMNTGLTGQDVNARRTSLLGLVKNGTVASLVIEELGPLLDGVSQSDLLRKIEASYVGGDLSDLMQISATADSPEIAAAIANSWAKHYINHINSLYGELPVEMAEVVERELDNARAGYEAAQQAYEDFLANNDIQTLTRQIEEKQNVIRLLQKSRQSSLQGIITQTLTYRQDIVATYLDTIQENRLLALTGEQEANRALIQSVIDAISQSRQLAFTTEHKARVQLFTQYAGHELQNRLLAIQQEQDAKTKIFKAYSDADIKAKLAVFNQQVDSHVGSLVGLYDTKQRLEFLLEQASALQQQIEAAGEAGAQSNALPLLLLKIEAYAATTPATSSTVLPTAASTTAIVAVGEPSKGIFNLDLNGSNTLDASAENQAADIAVLIDTLTRRIAELDAQIEETSLSLFNNEGYQLLNGERPEDDPLYAAIQQQYLALFDVGELVEASDTVAAGSVLSEAILAKYDELFGIGPLANASLTISNTAPIYAALEAQYPSLFQLGDLTQLGGLLAGDSALDATSQQELLDLLLPVDDVASYLAAADAGSESLMRLEEELNVLQAALEQEQARQHRLMQDRDLAQEVYNALNSKRLELTLQRTAASREVRLAAAATPPDNPVPGMSLILTGAAFGIAGFLLAMTIALLASYMDAEPFLSRLRPPQVSPAGSMRR